jgi:nitronate monooxygenase
VLDEWLTRIRRELAAHDAAHPEKPAAPFAVNQIVHKSNDRIGISLLVGCAYRVQ